MKLIGLLLISLLLGTTALSQRNQPKQRTFNKPNRANSIFLQKQWWLGFKAGPNLSKAVVQTSYDVIAPINYDVREISKKYKDFYVVGSQATFEITFFLRGFCASFQPGYRTNGFTYGNRYEWADAEDDGKRFLLDYEQRQKVAYLDLPLIFKYEFPIGKLILYLQGGYYSSILLDATKSVTISGVDFASGGIHTFKDEPITIGAKDLFAKNHWGLMAGGGLYYNLGNVRLNLDISYQKGMSNVASTRNRYGSDRLSGVGDSLDDIRLNSLALSAGCLFPLRFLGSGFKSMIE